MTAGAASVAERPPPPVRPGPDARPGRTGRPTGLSWAMSAGPFVVVGLPLLVAAWAVRDPQWHPIADLAQSELRVRDVGGSDTPLIGLAGRLGPLGDAGSHPGPLSFWLLAPLYRLLGSTAWAFSVASVVLHAVAAAVALVVARRRGGAALAIAVAAALVLLVVAYGPSVYIEPWNPYLPVTWWVVFLLAAWSVLERDWPMLPVAALAGSFCAQTHLPYLGLVGGLGAFTVGATAMMAALAAWRRRAGRDPEQGDGVVAPRSTAWRWWVVAAVVGVALWIAPVIDQANGTGNLSKIRDTLSDPEEEPVEATKGAQEVLDRLDVRTFTTIVTIDPPRPADWNVPGLVLLATWAAAALVSIRQGPPALRRLHLLLAAALVLAFTSAARVSGVLWFYLFLWCMALTALMLLAVAWTAAAAVEPRLSAPDRRRLRAGAVAVAALVAVVGSAVATARHLDAEPARADLSAVLGQVSDDTTARLARGDVPGGGRDGRYLVRWSDPVTIGSQGVGLVNELERAGFTVGVDRPHGPGATRHRVLPPERATALVQLVVGPGISEWQARPDVVEVSYVDRRTPDQRAESLLLTRSVDQRLRASGRADVADDWAQNLFTATLTPGLPGAIVDDMIRVLDLGAPVAVFVGPPPER